MGQACSLVASLVRFSTLAPICFSDDEVSDSKYQLEFASEVGRCGRRDLIVGPRQ